MNLKKITILIICLMSSLSPIALIGQELDIDHNQDDEDLINQEELIDQIVNLPPSPQEDEFGPQEPNEVKEEQKKELTEFEISVQRIIQLEQIIMQAYSLDNEMASNAKLSDLLNQQGSEEDCDEKCEDLFQQLAKLAAEQLKSSINELYTIARDDINPSLSMAATVSLIKSLKKIGMSDYKTYAKELLLPEKFYCDTILSCEKVIEAIANLADSIPDLILEAEFSNSLKAGIETLKDHRFFKDTMNFRLKSVLFAAEFYNHTQIFSSNLVGLPALSDENFIDEFSDRLDLFLRSNENPLIKYQLKNTNDIFVHLLAEDEEWDDNGQMNATAREMKEVFLSITPEDMLGDEIVKVVSKQYIEKIYQEIKNWQPYVEYLLMTLKMNNLGTQAIQLYLPRTKQASPVPFLTEILKPVFEHGLYHEEQKTDPLVLSYMLARFASKEYQLPWGYQVRDSIYYLVTRLKQENHDPTLYNNSIFTLEKLLLAKIYEYDGVYAVKKREMVLELGLKALEDNEEVATVEEKEQWLAENIPGFRSIFYHSLMFKRNMFDIMLKQAELLKVKTTATYKYSEASGKLHELIIKTRDNFAEIACFAYWYAPEAKDKRTGILNQDKLLAHLKAKPEYQKKVYFNFFSSEENNEEDLLDLSEICGYNPNQSSFAVSNSLTAKKIKDIQKEGALSVSHLVMDLPTMVTTASLVNLITHPIRPFLKQQIGRAISKRLIVGSYRNIQSKFLKRSAQYLSKKMLFIANEIPDVVGAAAGAVMFTAVSTITMSFTPYARPDMSPATKENVTYYEYLVSNYATELVMGFGLFYFMPKVQALFISRTGNLLGYKNMDMAKFEQLKLTGGLKSRWHEAPLTASRLMADTLLFGSMPYVERIGKKLTLDGEQDDIWQGWDSFHHDWKHGLMVGAFFSSSHSFWRDANAGAAIKFNQYKLHRAYRFFKLRQNPNLSEEKFVRRLEKRYELNKKEIEQKFEENLINKSEYDYMINRLDYHFYNIVTLNNFTAKNIRQNLFDLVLIHKYQPVIESMEAIKFGFRTIFKDLPTATLQRLRAKKDLNNN